MTAVDVSGLRDLAQVLRRWHDPMADMDMLPVPKMYIDEARVVLASEPFRAALAEARALPSGASLIAAERRRQVDVEGWTAEHDAAHGSDVLIRAAIAYQAGEILRWPFDPKWWKPKDHLSNLIRAGALYRAAADVRGESVSMMVKAVADEIDGILAKVAAIREAAGS